MCYFCVGVNETNEAVMGSPDPITDISVCFKAMSKDIGSPHITYISEKIIDLVKEKTGCKTLKEMESEYGKRFPDSHPLKIKIIKNRVMKNLQKDLDRQQALSTIAILKGVDCMGDEQAKAILEKEYVRIATEFGDKYDEAL